MNYDEWKLASPPESTEIVVAVVNTTKSIARKKTAMSLSARSVEILVGWLNGMTNR